MYSIKYANVSFIGKNYTVLAENQQKSDVWRIPSYKNRNYRQSV